MTARAARQAVMTGGHRDWRQALVWLPRLMVYAVVFGVLSLVWMKFNDPQFLPIQKVRAQAAFINLTEEMLLERVGDIQGGYFNVDVMTVQKNVESLPWVDQAVVKRTWPDTLLISVTEQNAVATWQGEGLVNERGELFFPDKASFPTQLPQLSGPSGSHAQLLAHYQTIRDMVQPTGLVIVQLELDARRAMRIRFATGLTVLLGRGDYIARVGRFVRLYRNVLANEVGMIETIDMRYTNGVALTRQQ